MAEGHANPATEGTKPETKGGIARYTEAIERYERGTEEWKTRSETIIKIYLDQHRTKNAPRRFALLWSNIETLKPAVYARLPVAVVSRRYRDPDPAGRKAAEVMERCINTTFDLYGVNETMQNVRDDRLLTSRGQAWVRYEADTEQYEAEEAEEAEEGAEPGQSYDRLKSEKCCVDYVNWSDFGHSMHRTWPEVTMVWRRVYLTRRKVEERWDKATANKLHYEVRQQLQQNTGDGKDATEPQAVVYEVWDKNRHQVCWLAKEEKLELETGDPPLKFRDFFPCPKPTYGSKATGSLIPTPDYRYYQDQAEEIDDLTQKIADLTSWLRLRGIIPGGPSSEGADAIEQLLKLNGNQVFVKVESWAGFSEKGGAKGLVEWLPLDMVMAALKGAIEARRELKNDAFEITGISDILRGESDPQETLGAQQLKAQTGSRRIATTQRDLARFARDLAEMVGEVIAEQFQPETMAAMSGIEFVVEPPPQLIAQAKGLLQQMQMAQAAQPPPVPGAPGAAVPASAPGAPPPDPRMQQLQQQMQPIQQQLQDIKLNADALALLRDEKTRGFRIEIETDSTIEPDEQAEKQRRIEFLEATGGFMQQAQGILQLMPTAAPMVGEMLLFMVRGFRAGRNMEDVIERSVQQLSQQAQQGPPPDPRVEFEKQKFELQMMLIKAKGEQETEKHGLEMQKLQAEVAAQQAELAIDVRKAQAEAQHDEQKLALEARGQEQEAYYDQQSQEREAEHARESHEVESEAAHEKHELAMEAMRAKVAKANADPQRPAPAKKRNGPLPGATSPF